MANWSKSGSKSESWEGIEGYVPEWYKKSDMYGKQETRKKQDQKLISDRELSSIYGFVYGDDIDKRYDKAVNAKYDELDAQNRLARDTSMNDMSVGMDSYLDVIRQQNAKRTQSGIMKGSSAAQEMQGMFAAQGTMSESQQEYQKQMGLLGKERGTAAYAAKIDSLKERNNVANQMGTLGVQKYGMDVQDEAAYLSYLGQDGANRAAYNSALAAWNATEGQNTRRKTSESNSWSESYDNSADIAAEAQRYAADRAAESAAYSGGGGGGNGRGAYDEAVSAYMAGGLTESQAKVAALGGDWKDLPGGSQGFKANGTPNNGGSKISDAGKKKSPYKWKNFYNSAQLPKLW